MTGITLTLHRSFEKGKLCFDLPNDNKLKEAIAKVLITCREKSNDFVCVTIKRPAKPRTTGARSQNHHLNGHIMQICAETGNDYETIKYCIKMIAVEEMGYPFKTVAGHVLPQRECECSTEDCVKLIEASHILAANLGIILKETQEDNE